MMCYGTNLMRERIYKGDVEFLTEWMLKSGEKLSERDVLHAIRGQNLDMIEFALVNTYAENYTEDIMFGFKILKTGNIDLVEYFRERCEIINKCSQVLRFTKFIFNGHTCEFLEYILDNGLYSPEIVSEIDGLLMFAVEFGRSTEVVKMIHEMCPNVNTMEEEFMKTVLFKGSVDIWEHFYGNITMDADMLMRLIDYRMIVWEQRVFWGKNYEDMRISLEILACFGKDVLIESREDITRIFDYGDDELIEVFLPVVEEN